MTQRAKGALLVALAVQGAGLISCDDKTHENEVAALGSEDPSVPQGPLHRPGQPCVTCHGGSGPASQQFSLGGTVYQVKDQPAPAVSAIVTIEDITGTVQMVQTNQAGNFYITVQQWQPTYPLWPQVALGKFSQQMVTHVARDGSCADCHTSVAGPTSAGAVYVEMVAGGP